MLSVHDELRSIGSGLTGVVIDPVGGVAGDCEAVRAVTGDVGKILEEKDPIMLRLYAEYNNVLMRNMRLNEFEVSSLIEYMDAESCRVRQAQ